MKEFQNNAYFWQKVDAAYMSGDYTTVYKKGTDHPAYPGLVFPCDYGHINSGDGDTSMKAFKGTKNKKVEAIVVCANLLEKELNAILLIGLNEEEEIEVMKFLNSNEFQKAVILRRGNEIPPWAIIE